MTIPNAVAALVSAQRLQAVPPDIVAARARLARADQKLAAARQIARIDIEVAYFTAYDATRIAVTAHMLSLGYRVRAVPRVHEAVGVYAEAMLNTPSASQFQRMRRRRNRAEYDDIIIGRRTSKPILPTLKRSSMPSARTSRPERRAVRYRSPAAASASRMPRSKTLRSLPRGLQDAS
jgi:hypothetical protein